MHLPTPTLLEDKMKIPVTCPECLCAVQGQIDTLVEYQQDNPIYEVTCRYGHSFTGRLADPHSTILFELGLSAILDGYYREAVSSFTASLESMHRLFLRVVFRDKGLEALLAEAWKDLDSQSERQLGAFSLVFLSEIQGKPPVFTNNHRKIRNQVIHKGKVPTRTQCLEYGEATLSHLLACIAAMQQKYGQELIESLLVSEPPSMLGSWKTLKVWSDVKLLPQTIEMTLREHELTRKQMEEQMARFPGIKQ